MRDLPPLAPPGTAYPVLLYDGDCRLCNFSAQLLSRLDRARRLHFLRQGGERGQALLRACGLDARQLDAVVLVTAPACSYIGAEAVLQALSLLGPGWRAMAAALRVIPPAWRDRLYRAVARRRQLWLRRHAVCPAAPPDD